MPANVAISLIGLFGIFLIVWAFVADEDERGQRWHR